MRPKQFFWTLDIIFINSQIFLLSTESKNLLSNPREKKNKGKFDNQ